MASEGLLASGGNGIGGDGRTGTTSTQGGECKRQWQSDGQCGRHSPLVRHRLTLQLTSRRMTHWIPDDPRGPAERAFRERMQPLLALADQRPDASELFIDGEERPPLFGGERQRFRYADLPGLFPVRSRPRGCPPSSPASSWPGPAALPLISVRSRPICASPTSGRPRPTTGM